MEDGSDLTYFVGEGGEFFGEDRLHAVGEGFVRLMVDFDDKAIGANSNGGAGKGQNFVALAGAVAGIDENGEVAALLDGGNDREVEGVAGKIGEGANAAFAEHDVVIALGKNVFGGHKELVEGGRHAAFEQDGLFGAAGALEERKILHVARADLDDVGVFLDEVQGFVVDRCGDNAEAVVSADFRKDFEAVFTVGMRRTVSSSLASRLTSLYGLLTGMHSTTPGRDSRTPRSTASLLPVMPMAVRIEPGMGCALRPRLSIRLQTSRICSSVAWDCMTTSMGGSPGAASRVLV